jgi:alkylhydroperoxidase family enzyme
VSELARFARREKGVHMDAASELRRLEESEGRREGALTSPRLRAFFECWLDTFLVEGAIDARLREQTILRIMWRRGRAYEWGNHYRLARQLGLTDDEVRAVRSDDVARDFSGATAVVLRAADEIVDDGQVSDMTMSQLREVFPDALLLQEFLYLVAGYQMFASVSASTREETHGATWPPDGIGPAS